MGVKQMMAGMGLGEDGMRKDDATVASATPKEACKNCAQDCEKPLRCSVCKSATYCSAKCQKEDWQFHKRNCKKAINAAPESAAAASAGATPAPSASSASSPPARPKGTERDVVANEDVGTWYSHREWKPDEPKKEFTPEHIPNATGSKAPETASV